MKRDFEFFLEQYEDITQKFILAARSNEFTLQAIYLDQLVNINKNLRKLERKKRK